jgi:hypothetical protein
MKQVALALVSGDAKYGPNDWICNTTAEDHLLGALRHLGKRGNDPDTKLPHIAHAISRFVLYECRRAYEEMRNVEGAATILDTISAVTSVPNWRTAADDTIRRQLVAMGLPPDAFDTAVAEADGATIRQDGDKAL